MYYVYLLEFPDGAQYVGCTNNIKRRKQQHNGKSRKLSSKLGCYLKEKGIILTDDDFKILAKFVDRKDALRTERDIALQKDKCGICLLNDNYTQECSRKGRNIGLTFKEYVVIYYPQGEVVKVADLKQYCEKNGLNYKNVQRTATKRYAGTVNGIKAIRIEEWNSMSEKERNSYKDGSFETIRELRKNEGVRQRQSKTYLVLTPWGETVKVTNLDRYAKEQGINAGNLHYTLSNPRRKASGYKVIKRI